MTTKNNNQKELEALEKDREEDNTHWLQLGQTTGCTRGSVSENGHCFYTAIQKQHTKILKKRETSK